MPFFNNKRKDFSIQPPKLQVNSIPFFVTDSANIDFTFANNNLTGDLTLTGVTAGTYGDVINVPQVTVDQWGRITNITLVPISTSGLALEINGTPNSSQTLLNLVPGTNITITDLGSGNIRFDATGGGGGSGTVTSVSAGTGMSFTTITTSGSVDIDTSKVPYLPAGFSTGLLKWNGSAWIFDNSSYLTSAVLSVSAGINISVTGTPTNPIINSLSDRYKTTSTTSNSVINGIKTFTVDANLSYIPLQEILVVHNPTNHMHGEVVSYSGTTLVVDIKNHTGGGTYTSWVINLDGTPVDAITGSGTINELAYFTGATTIGSLTVAIYPNLTEVSYLRGVTSSVQNQLNSKVPNTRQVATTGSLTGGGDLSADRTLSLVNDSNSPGPNKVYGTDGSGVKGWKNDPSGGGGVTSVGLSMPSAFSVANSPVTGAGTLTVTGAGTISQYVRGDGSLQTNAGSFGVTADGVGGVVQVGNVGYVVMTYAGTIAEWYLTADVSGTVSFDITKASGVIPTVSIIGVGGIYPTLTSLQIATGSTLTGWTTTFSAGDIFGFIIRSSPAPVTIKNVTLSLRVTKS
jgi:hypothetical protein